MAIFHHAIDVDASPETCWRAFADLPRWASWFPRLSAVRALADERLPAGAPFCVGGELELVLDTGPFGHKAIRVVVRECIANERVRWTGGFLGMKVNHLYSFEVRAPGTTRFTSHEEVEGLAARLIRGKAFEHIDREAHESLTKFKRLVEGHA